MLRLAQSNSCVSNVKIIILFFILQEKPAVDEADGPYGNRKKLRTVKSAESLVHCLKESPQCPNRNEIGQY